MHTPPKEFHADFKKKISPNTPFLERSSFVALKERREAVEWPFGRQKSHSPAGCRVDCKCRRFILTSSYEERETPPTRFWWDALHPAGQRMSPRGKATRGFQGPRGRPLPPSWSSSQPVWVCPAAFTRCHRLGGSNNRHLLSHCSGGWKSRIKPSRVRFWRDLLSWPADSCLLIVWSRGLASGCRRGERKREHWCRFLSL